MFGFGKRRRRARWSLDDELVRFSQHDNFTLANALEGVLVTGATGSGKSSGSGRTLALAYLHGFGGLVLTAKPDELALWTAYCKTTGRLKDLRVFSPDNNKFRFNFLDYELKQQGLNAGLTDNLVSMFTEVLQIAQRSSGGGGREDEGYWQRSLKQLLRNVVDLLILAKGRLAVSDLYRVVVSAPTSPEQVNSDGWKQSSFCFQCLRQADRVHKSSRQSRDLGLVADYFLLEMPTLSEKTRSVIISTFTSMIDVLQRGVLAELFCQDTTITPDIVAEGAILVIDLPVKRYAESGQFAQVLWKAAFQRAIERRNIAANPRPVFLWADEAQFFVTSPNDMQFQTTCRALRVATVLLSQNISNFYAALGGTDKGKAEADSLFANLATKIFHANSDPITNEWASSMIGRSRQYLANCSSSNQQQSDWFFGTMFSGPAPVTCGVSEQIDFDVQPRVFTTLRKGGRANRALVDGIVFQGGRRFRATGKTWTPVTFQQNA